jgi:outer membrane beta-barrel protein
MRAAAFGVRLLLLSALFATPAFAQKTEEEAGDVSEVDKDASGPLRDRVRPVSGHRFLMDGRFEIGPNLGISARDAFYTKYVLGLSLMYHITETFGLGLSGGYALSVVSGAAQICETDPATGVSKGCRRPTDDELSNRAGVSGRSPAFGRQTLLLNLDAEWAPIYGKLSLIAEAFVGFNMYLVVGPSFILYGPSAASQFTVGGNVGIGFRFFITKWLVVKADFRDVIYNESFARVGVSSSDPNPTSSSLRNQFMFNVGLTFFVPTAFEEGRR